MKILEQLRAARAALQTAMEETLKGVEARVSVWTDEKTKVDAIADGEARKVAVAALGPIPDLTAEERSTFDANVAEARALDERIAELEVVESRRLAAAAGVARTSPAVVRSEPLTYNRHVRTSYFKDLACLATRGEDMNNAEARLGRHGKEMDVELPARAQRREDRAEQEMRGLTGPNAPSVFEKRVNPNRTDGQGGYLVPPLWLMDELIPILRAGRTVANQVRSLDLPDGTDSVNIPKLSTGTATAVQTADAAAVQSTDFTDTSVSAGVKTIAGQEDIAIQLLEQSPLNLDEVIFTDLIADYNQKLDAQVISGSNANGQVKGLYSSAGASPWSSYNQVTYTDASPTAAEMFVPFAQSLSKIAQTRYSVANTKVFLHPRRWFWLIGSVDTVGRPLFLTNPMAGFNSLGVTGGAEAEGFVGTLGTGTPVFIDANMPVADTAGGGTLQDIALTLKSDDAFLFEGQLRQRTLPEILSGTLQVRFQVYNYLAFLVRYDQAIAIASGSGFAAPSGY